jgi:hypothetical protein
MKEHDKESKKREKKQEKVVGFPCVSCDETFKNKRALKQHKDEVHAPKTQKCSAANCDKSFRTSKELQVHFKTDHPTETFKKPESSENIPAGYELCPFCGKAVRNLQQIHLKKHMNIMNNVYYHCDHCAFKAPLKRQIRDHVAQHMKTRKMLQCRHCERFFNGHSSRLQHEKRVHQGKQRVSKCECGKEFKSHYALSRHKVLVHSKVGNFACEICGKVEVNTRHLQVHMENQHMPKVPCDICGKMCGPGVALTRHKEYVHEGKRNKRFQYPQEGFKCPICDKYFSKETSLKVHIAMQHNAPKKPCQVPGCCYSSPRNANLKIHYEKHKDISQEEKEQLISELKSK